jgi:predicted dehydrogenase/nucleoside-diphosphate-sugar epimerase
MRRTCLVGAGQIAPLHARALGEVPGVELVAVCDIDRARAQRLADDYDVRHVFTSVDDAIASGTFEQAHVVVPPDLHTRVAGRLIDAGMGVLVEKPLGVSKPECQEIARRASECGVQLGVNHHSVFYPAHLRLREALLARSLGALEHLIITVIRPRHWVELAGHWALRHPKWRAYESAIHPLAQIYDLAGPAARIETLVSDRQELPSGNHRFDTWLLSFACERAHAQVLFSYGDYPTYGVVAICSDGVITAEMDQNRFTAIGRSRWERTRVGRHHVPIHAATQLAAQELGAGLGNLIREASSELPRGGHFMAMRNSIAAFHNGSSDGQPVSDGDFATQVVAMCDAATEGITDDQPRAKPAPPRPLRGRCDAVLIGAAAPAGRVLAERLSSNGMSVRIVASDDAADARDAGAISALVKDAQAVVHLANLESASPVAKACLQAGVDRLIAIGSVTSLYLGEAGATITGSTPPDPRVTDPDPYASDTAQSEWLLKATAAEGPLPLCILRAGIVLGAGGNPLHPGFGVWRGETHCVGWNRGTNPLPLVLVNDVAAAIRLAITCEPPAMGSYNLVGDVRLSARECVEQLREGMQRPLVFHPAHPMQHLALRTLTWSASAALRRERGRFPSYRMIKSRGCPSTFDCSDVKRELGWTPVADRAQFIQEGLRVYGRPTHR